MKVTCSLGGQAQGTFLKVISSLCPVSGQLHEDDLHPGGTGTGHLRESNIFEGDLLPVPRFGASP